MGALLRKIYLPQVCGRDGDLMGLDSNHLVAVIQDPAKDRLRSVEVSARVVNGSESQKCSPGIDVIRPERLLRQLRGLTSDLFCLIKLPEVNVGICKIVGDESSK